MKLKDFPFNSAIGFAWFDQWILTALKLTEKAIPCNINPDTSQRGGFNNLLPHVGVFNWEINPSNICYGQFLEYINNSKTANFWAGLDISKDKDSEVKFILWFDKLNSGCNLLNHTVTIPNSCQLVTEKNCYWIAFDNTCFDNFCNNPPTSINNISDFIKNVLTNI